MSQLCRFVIFFSLVCLGGVAGCDNKKTSSDEAKSDSNPSIENVIDDPSSRGNHVRYVLDLSVDSTKLSNDEKKLFSDLQSNNPVDFNEITNLFVAKHFRTFESMGPKSADLSLSKLYGDISSLGKKIVERTDLHKIKMEAETAVSPDLKYNKSYFTIPHVVYRHRLQCSSGTAFQQVMARNHLGAAGFRSKNVLIIYTQGHVLYGYAHKDKSSGDWLLTGIESTAAGRAAVPFGPMEELYKVRNGAYRIIDAELWMIYQIISTGIQDHDDALQTLLDATDEKYDDQIPLDELEKNISNLGSNSDGNLEGAPDHLAFGTVRVPDGDIERITADELKPSFSVGQGNEPASSRRHEGFTVVTLPRQETLEGMYHVQFDRETVNWFCMKKDGSREVRVEHGEAKGQWALELEWYYEITQTSEYQYELTRYVDPETRRQFENESPTEIPITIPEGAREVSAHHEFEWNRNKKDTLDLEIRFTESYTGGHGTYRFVESFRAGDLRSCDTNGAFRLTRVEDDEL